MTVKQIGRSTYVFGPRPNGINSPPREGENGTVTEAVGVLQVSTDDVYYKEIQTHDRGSEEQVRYFVYKWTGDHWTGTRGQLELHREADLELNERARSEGIKQPLK